jgi:hypothetical protein
VWRTSRYHPTEPITCATADGNMPDILAKTPANLQAKRDELCKERLRLRKVCGELAKRHFVLLAQAMGLKAHLTSELVGEVQDMRGIRKAISGLDGWREKVAALYHLTFYADERTYPSVCGDTHGNLAEDTILAVENASLSTHRDVLPPNQKTFLGKLYGDVKNKIRRALIVSVLGTKASKQQLVREGILSSEEESLTLSIQSGPHVPRPEGWARAKEVYYAHVVAAGKPAEILESYEFSLLTQGAFSGWDDGIRGALVQFVGDPKNQVEIVEDASKGKGTSKGATNLGHGQGPGLGRCFSGTSTTRPSVSVRSSTGTEAIAPTGFLEEHGGGSQPALAAGNKENSEPSNTNVQEATAAAGILGEVHGRSDKPIAAAVNKENCGPSVMGLLGREQGVSTLAVVEERRGSGLLTRMLQHGKLVDGGPLGVDDGSLHQAFGKEFDKVGRTFGGGKKKKSTGNVVVGVSSVSRGESYQGCVLLRSNVLTDFL